MPQDPDQQEPQDQPVLRVSKDPLDSPGLPEHLARRERQEPKAARERRVARVQLARLEVSDLLALLGLPANEVRLDPVGLVVLRVHPAHLAL